MADFIFFMRSGGRKILAFLESNVAPIYSLTRDGTRCDFSRFTVSPRLYRVSRVMFVSLMALRLEGDTMSQSSIYGKIFMPWRRRNAAIGAMHLVKVRGAVAKPKGRAVY